MGDDVESLTLRSREVRAGERVIVWYEQEEGKVRYHGTVTRLSSALGMRVWFDAHSYTEQEWVTMEDEWRFESNDEMPAPTDASAGGAGAEKRSKEEEEAACEFHRVTVRLGKLVQLLPTASKAAREPGASAGADGAATTPASGEDERDLAIVPVTYHLTADGIFASEPEQPAERTSMPARRAPRRPPANLAAKYGKCEYSKLPALYKDPKTGVRYATVGAFQALRARHAGAAGGSTSAGADGAAQSSAAAEATSRRGGRASAAGPAAGPAR